MTTHRNFNLIISLLIELEPSLVKCHVNSEITSAKQHNKAVCEVSCFKSISQVFIWTKSVDLLPGLVH